MITKKILAKEEITKLFKQKWSLELLITTLLVSLLLITGVFVNYRKDNFNRRIEILSPLVFSSDPSYLGANLPPSKKSDTIFIENMNPPVLIFATPYKTKTINNQLITGIARKSAENRNRE